MSAQARRPRLVEAKMTMEVPEAPRTWGFWCTVWVMLAIVFGAMAWYQNWPDIADIYPLTSETRADRGDRNRPAPPQRTREEMSGAGYSEQRPRSERATAGASQERRERAREADAAATPSSTAGAAPRFVANGRYVAQLASFRSRAAAERAWERLSERAPTLFEEARLDVERAEIKERGIFYRMRAGHFADRANALRFCERLNRVHQDCMVTRR